MKRFFKKITPEHTSSVRNFFYDTQRVAVFSLEKISQERAFSPQSPVTEDTRVQAPKGDLISLIGTIDEGLPAYTP